MDAFFDDEPSSQVHSPSHTPSPSALRRESAPPPIVTSPVSPVTASYGSPTHYGAPTDFDNHKSSFGASSFYPDAFTPSADYSFTPSSAPEMSHVDMVHQTISAAARADSAKLEGSRGPVYWSPPPDMATHTPTPTSSQAANSFLSDLYVSEPMTATQSNGAVGDGPVNSSGVSSPTWSLDGSQGPSRAAGGAPQSPTYAPEDQDHTIFRRASCPTWSTPGAEPQTTPTQQYPQHPRDEMLPPVSALLFEHHRPAHAHHQLQLQPMHMPYDYHRYDDHTPPESVAPSYELKPVIYGLEGPLAVEPASFHTRNIDEVYMRPPEGRDYSAPLDYQSKSPGNSPTMVSTGQLSMAHTIPVMHTDDAASKETQHLRRRCFNCRATEPPSWRRSTLNPGKIVCNKCGLYERTHLRPRPHRFDELRGGPAAAATKNRKASKSLIAGMGMPGGKMQIKQDSIHRRASVASMTSVNSMTSIGSESWDDYSVSSASSTPPFNSPTTLEFPMHGQHGGNHPISIPQPPPMRPAQARKTSSSSLRGTPWTASPVSSSSAMAEAQVPRRPTMPPAPYELARRGSFDVSTLAAAHRRQQIPVETGWQTIPMDEVRQRSQSTSVPRKSGPVPARSVAAA